MQACSWCSLARSQPRYASGHRRAPALVAERLPRPNMHLAAGLTERRLGLRRWLGRRNVCRAEGPHFAARRAIRRPADGGWRRRRFLGGLDTAHLGVGRHVFARGLFSWPRARYLAHVGTVLLLHNPPPSRGDRAAGTADYVRTRERPDGRFAVLRGALRVLTFVRERMRDAAASTN